MTDPLKSKIIPDLIMAALNRLYVQQFSASRDPALFGNPALTTCREIKPQQEGRRQRTAATITLKGTAKNRFRDDFYLFIIILDTVSETFHTRVLIIIIIQFILDAFNSQGHLTQQE